jgi:hypothetical protein
LLREVLCQKTKVTLCISQLLMLLNIATVHFWKLVRIVGGQQCGWVVQRKKLTDRCLPLIITWEVKKISLGGNGMNQI